MIIIIINSIFIIIYLRYFYFRYLRQTPSVRHRETFILSYSSYCSWYEKLLSSFIKLLLFISRLLKILKLEFDSMLMLFTFELVFPVLTTLLLFALVLLAVLLLTLPVLLLKTILKLWNLLADC